MNIVYAGAFFIMQRVREQIQDFYGKRTDGGSGITVAMLDTGVSFHPDLAGKVLCFRDLWDRDIPRGWAVETLMTTTVMEPMWRESSVEVGFFRQANIEG